MNKGAIFSTDGVYRWTLTRDWLRAPARRLTVIGLNPSTADAHKDDPTVRRLVNFAVREGLGGLTVVNIFAYKATDPYAMKRAAVDPVGSANDAAILAACCTEGVEPLPIVIAAWGAHGGHMNRGDEVRRMLHEHNVRVHHFGLTKKGFPRHPLYLPSGTPLTLWEYNA